MAAQPIFRSVAPKQTTPSSHAIDVIGLSAGYPGNPHAIENLSFSVTHGDRVAVIGPNGAGKSTLFRAIVGLIPFTKGEISVNGKDCIVSHDFVGYVPQHEAIDWSFPVTVHDVVMMGRTRQIGWFRWPRAQDRELVKHVLETLSLTHLVERQIGELSGGQRRRVFIARALAQETNVLLMDEPFTGVDTTAEREIMTTLDVLQDQGITVLLATHDMHKAATHFDKMLLINQRVVAYGTPPEVMRPDILKQAYSGAVQVFNDQGQMFMIADEHGCGD
jgi:ABC-type Mn2+/Zn2+ transport system ATPase subunit